MTRNNADFQGGINHEDDDDEEFYDGPIGQNWLGYHASPRKNRRSIEANGLRANTSASVHEGDAPHGVYVSNSRQEHEFLLGDSNPNKDIYEVNLPVAYADPDMPHQSVYSPSDVAPHNVRRVGHTTADGEVHWHLEEHCNG